MDNVDYTALFTPVSTGTLDAITAVAPIGLGIGVAVLAIVLGWRMVKRFAK